jgi:crotonobetainyl-CoA:carnitine CoA-transferase CaiB-like acyl-CoA transferase
LAIIFERIDMTLPLQGIRVIDFTHVLAGPACAYYLALLGADVIKVEGAIRGDAMRHRGGSDPDRAAAGMSTSYLTQGAGKRSIALDIATETGRDVMERLLKGADVLVENHMPKTLQKLGFEESRTRQLNSRLIHCAMTGYGRGGPMENARAYDVNIQAISGLMTLTGTAETGPLRTGAPIIDYGIALAATLAISAALYQREQTGQGAFIDVSMLETAHALMASTVTDFLVTGNVPKPRGNSANSGSATSGNFHCKEGILSLGVSEESQFVLLAETLGKPEWISDPRFANSAIRKKNSAEMAASLTDVLATRTAEEWEALLLAKGVPAARMRTLPESLALPQVAARRFLDGGPGDDIGRGTLPFRFADGGPLSAHCPSPEHGEDSLVILRELGFTDAEIETLLAEGTIHSFSRSSSTTPVSGKQ